MKINMFSLLLIIVSVGCDSKNSEEELMMNTDDTSIEISYTGTNGRDLLNPENSGYFRSSDIKISYFVNNRRCTFIEDIGPKNSTPRGFYSLDHPEGFLIYKNELTGFYTMRVFSKSDYRLENRGFDKNNRASVFISLPDGSEDTIVAEYRFSKNSIMCTKLWYSDQLVWSMEENTQRFIRITK